MQDGALHAVQSRSHLFYRPDGALLRGLLGAVHGNRAFDKDAPLYGILEGCAQQPMNLVDRRPERDRCFCWSAWAVRVSSRSCSR